MWEYSQAISREFKWKTELAMELAVNSLFLNIVHYIIGGELNYSPPIELGHQSFFASQFIEIGFRACADMADDFGSGEAREFAGCFE